MVLAHELAHIQRHDWVVQVLADAARAIYWFNPIFWLASSRLRRESEHACDDAVLRLGAAGTQYAEELLAMTRALRSNERLQSPILAMAQPSHLEQRLVALLNPSLNRLAATPWAVIVVAGVAIALTLPLAAVRPEAETRNIEAQPAFLPVAEAQPAVLSVAATQPTSPTPPTPQPEPPSLKTTPPGNNIPAIESMPPEAEAAAPVTAEPAAVTAVAATPVVNATVNSTPPPPFDCKVTSSRVQMKTATIEKSALGSGPWLINDDRTIWAADQPYVANRSVNTVWMRPANTELTITARDVSMAARLTSPSDLQRLTARDTSPLASCSRRQAAGKSLERREAAN